MRDWWEVLSSGCHQLGLWLCFPWKVWCLRQSEIPDELAQECYRIDNGFLAVLSGDRVHNFFFLKMSKKIEYFVGMINKGIENKIVTSMFFTLLVAVVTNIFC